MHYKRFQPEGYLARHRRKKARKLGVTDEP